MRHCPTVDAPAAMRRYRLLHHAIAAGWVASAHDLADGGLAVALAECAIGGRLGARIDLAHVPVAGKPESAGTPTHAARPASAAGKANDGAEPGSHQASGSAGVETARARGAGAGVQRPGSERTRIGHWLCRGRQFRHGPLRHSEWFRSRCRTSECCRAGQIGRRQLWRDRRFRHDKWRHSEWFRSR